MSHDAPTFLAARAHDAAAVTYALLASATGISASEAQEYVHTDSALAHFAAGRNDVHLIYAVAGARAGGTSVALVAADKLEHARQEVDAQRVFAYALQPLPTPDAALLAAAGREALCGTHVPRADKRAAPQPDAHKKRKIVRTEKTKNEKGYTVTRDVEVYVSDDEAAPQPAPQVPSAPAPAPAPKSARAKAPKQASLASFFKQPGK